MPGRRRGAAGRPRVQGVAEVDPGLAEPAQGCRHLRCRRGRRRDRRRRPPAGDRCAAGDRALECLGVGRPDRDPHGVRGAVLGSHCRADPERRAQRPISTAGGIDRPEFDALSDRRAAARDRQRHRGRRRVGGVLG